MLGGRATPTAPAEAEIGRCYLTLAGLEPGRIATEGHSRHTLENLRTLCVSCNSQKGAA